MLAEAAGGLVLSEMVLDRALTDACAEAGISIRPDMVSQERRLLAETLAGVAGVNDDETEVLIERVRASRGLGPVRFSALLERNAGLRALARHADGETLSRVSDDELQQAYAIKHGERFRSRLILVPDAASAAAVLRRVRPEDGGAPEEFALVAAQTSLDPTASRGGLLDPISPEDPSYPLAFRRALTSLSPGQVSDPISVTWPDRATNGTTQGLAIVQAVERVSYAAPSLDTVRDSLTREIRLVRERAAMDRIARELTAQGMRETTVLDDALEWSRAATLP